MKSHGSISNWPAIYRNTRKTTRYQKLRIFFIIIFSVLYVAFIGFFGRRLSRWNENDPGKCYEWTKLSIRNYKHPHPDYWYLGITFTAFLTSFIIHLDSNRPSSRFQSDVQSARMSGRREKVWRGSLLLLSLIQLIVHLSSIIVLRTSDQHFLVSDNSENQWSFGQVMVVTMLTPTFVEFYKSVQVSF